MKSLINKLISLNTNRQEPFVVSIFGQTASGKTTFIKKLVGLPFPINSLSIIGSPFIIQIHNSLKGCIEICVNNANETIIFDDVSSTVEYLKNYRRDNGKIIEEIIIKQNFCHFNQPLKIIDCNYFIYNDIVNEAHISHERLRSIISASNLVLYCMVADRAFSKSDLSNIVQLLDLSPEEFDLVVTRMDIIRFNDRMNDTHDEIELVKYWNNVISKTIPYFTGKIFFGE